MPDILEVTDLSAGYGAAVVLHGVSFSLEEGRAMALLGRNGTGKTTLINTLVGLTTLHGGSIRLAGTEIAATRPDRRAGLGIGWVPQERNIFRSLTVEENLTSVARPGKWTAAKVFELFPRLGERRRNMGNQLSGGEQQMLAISRALVLNPRLLLLDEPLEGLAPIIVEEVLAALGRVLTEEGMSAIVVEQKARKILSVTQHVVVLDRGSIVHEGTSAALLDDPASMERHLGVAHEEPVQPGA